MPASPLSPNRVAFPIVDHTTDLRDGEIAERRSAKPTIEQALRTRLTQDKKAQGLPANIIAPQKKQTVGAPKVPKLLSPKTPKTVLNRQKQLAIANRRSLHFVQDVLLMAQYLAGVLATALVGYGIGAGFASYSTGSYLFAANTGMAILLLGAAWYAYGRFVKPADYLVNAGLSYACAIQRAVAKSQEADGAPLELPTVHPNHPITFLRNHYVAYVMGYIRFVLFTQPLILFVAGLSVLVTAAFHHKWYIWSIGACFVTMGSLWFVAVWTLYMWLKRKVSRMSSQHNAFFTEFLPAKAMPAEATSAANAAHPHTE